MKIPVCHEVRTFYVGVVILFPAVIAKVAVEAAVSRGVLPVTHSQMPPLAHKNTD